jgi:hypothetical protein
MYEHPDSPIEYNGLKIRVYQDEDPTPPSEWDCPENGAFLVADHRDFAIGDVHWEPDSETWVRFPLYAYVHSGVALSMSPFRCPWDSGQVGWVWINTRDCPEPETSAQGILDSWNMYLSGQVYCYTIEEEGEVVGSLSGIYDDDPIGGYTLEEAKQEADYLLGERTRCDRMMAC